MGNLLKVLTREIENYPHFFLDFESKFVGTEGRCGAEGGRCFFFSHALSPLLFSCVVLTRGSLSALLS